MKDNEVEKNTTQQEPNQEGINSNKSIEIPPLNKSSEKNKGEIQEKSEDNEKINTNEKNNSKKSLTEKENRNGENKEKETDNVNIISKEKNINNINNENEEDITNIKYVSQNQFDKLKKEQIQKELNSKNAIHTIEDLQQNPNKKFTINSPRSLKALFDSGFSLDQLYYKTFEEFIDEHKEIMHLDEEVQKNRYQFYEKLRLDKINSLVEYREKLIQDEQDLLNNNINNENNQNEEDQIKPMKNIILDNDKRIAKEELDIMKKKHEKELANIIQLELDKDLFNLEMQKQQEEYAKEYEKLNFLNFNSGEISDKKDEEPSNERKSLVPTQNQERSSVSKNFDKDFFKSFSTTKKPKIYLDSDNNYLDNLHSLQQTLTNQKYEKKQRKVEQKLERLEKVRKITGEQRTLKKRIGEERAAQNLQKNTIDFNRRHEDLVMEIQTKKLNIFQNKKKFEDIAKNKNEWNNLKYIVKMDFIEDMKRKDENLRLIKYAELMEKQNRVERIKNDRSQVVHKKLLKKDYLNDERKKNIIKISNILNKGISEENLEKIIHQFPQNKEVHKVITTYKSNKKKLMDYNYYNTYKKSQNSTKKRPKSHNKLYLTLNNKRINKPKINEINKNDELPNLKIANVLNNNANNKALSETNKVTESDIKDKIRIYKELLYKKFYEKVQREKVNEELRLKELAKIEDKNKRYQLEKKFRKERAIVFMRLERENQKINDKINMYEFNLKNGNNAN